MSSSYTVFTIRGELGPFTKAELQAQLDAGELNASMRVTEVETGNNLNLSEVCGPPGGGASGSASRREGSGVKRKAAAPTTLQLELDEEESEYPDDAGSFAAPDESPATRPDATVGSPRETSAAGGPTIRYTSPGRKQETASASKAIRIIGGAMTLCVVLTIAVVKFGGPGPTAIAEGHSIVGMWEVELTDAGYRRAGKDAARQAPGTTAREFEDALRECRLFYEFRDDLQFTLHVTTWEGSFDMGDGKYKMINIWGKRSIQFIYQDGLEEGWHVELNEDGSLQMSLDGENLGTMVRAD